MKAALVSLLAVAALAAPARADECGQFWSFPGGVSSPAGWDALISFASCTQDRRVYLVEDAGELEGLVNALEDALAPSMQLYAAAIEQGPPDVQLRAAYHVGLAQIAMMTRARASFSMSLAALSSAFVASLPCPGMICTSSFMPASAASCAASLDIGERSIRLVAPPPLAGLRLCLRAAAPPTPRADTSKRNARPEVERLALRYHAAFIRAFVGWTTMAPLSCPMISSSPTRMFDIRIVW